MTGAEAVEHRVVLRDVRTLREVGELHPRLVERATWTRRDVEAGSFQLTVPRRYEWRGGWRTVDLDLVAAHRLVEVLRDDEVEFRGVLERRSIDRTGHRWTLGGPDLCSWWLRQRVVGPTEPDPREGPAESVVKGYVATLLGDGAPAEQRAEAYLSGLTWTVAADHGLGGTVDYPGQRAYLDQVVADLCRRGDVLPELTVHDGGYEFGVERPRDATVGTGNAPFGVDFNNVEQLVYREDWSERRNHLYVLGPGSGAEREMTEVFDADSRVADFRREGVYDARTSTTEPQRAEEGQLELLRHREASLTVSCAPFRGSRSSVYRRDFDVGWDVTFQESELRPEPVDLRIVGITVSLEREAGEPAERIRLEMGTYHADSQLRRLSRHMRRLTEAVHA